jgi:hypothetical protein
LGSLETVNGEDGGLMTQPGADIEDDISARLPCGVVKHESNLPG